MRRLIRWALRLFIVLVILVVAAILLLNTIAKQVLESRLRATTGMDVRIGQIDVGLLSPTVTIENFKLYNTPEFGGSLFIDMPELHMEYDPRAVRSGILHFKFVRLVLTEINVVQDKKGRSNMQDMDKKNRDAARGGKSSGDDLKFTGIDTLNLTLGKYHALSLASGRGEDIDFGIKDQILHNVKSMADVPSLNFVMAASTNTNFDATTFLKRLTAH
jgi:uncharacterized protein involved in outer membrane biogenesis